MIPLLRAAAISPALIWMQRAGLPWTDRLRAAGLRADILDAPERPVAFRAAARFLVLACRDFGPDLSVRAGLEVGVAPLANLGRIALGGPTLREFVARLERAYSHYSSHEQLRMHRVGDAPVLRHTLLMRLDDETLHFCQAYAAGLISALLAAAGGPGPRMLSLTLTPHPTLGLAHLAPWLAAPVVAARSGSLDIALADGTLDASLTPPAHGGTDAVAPRDWPPIRGDGTLSGSVRAVLPDLIATQAPTLGALAALAGTSARTLQRRLAAEGTSAARLVDGVRRELALARIAGGAGSIGAIAAEVGYGEQSSLSRAVRRWTDAPPRRLRAGGRPPGP